MSTTQEEFRTQEITINMGPQHPSTHGVLRLEIVTDGEIIKAAYPDLGYLHRCFEKHAENREYLQVVPFTDRLDYVAAMNQELGYCLAVEKLIEVEATPRAQTIRVIVSELQRIASHLLAIGTYSLDIGGFTPMLYAFRDREHILGIFEELSGARLLYNYVRPGGVARDLSRGLEEHIPASSKIKSASSAATSFRNSSKSKSFSPATRSSWIGPAKSASCPRTWPWPTASAA